MRSNPFRTSEVMTRGKVTAAATKISSATRTATAPHGICFRSMDEVCALVGRKALVIFTRFALALRGLFDALMVMQEMEWARPPKPPRFKNRGNSGKRTTHKHALTEPARFLERP